MRTLYLVFLTFSPDAGCLNAFLKDGSFFYQPRVLQGRLEPLVQLARVEKRSASPYV